MLCGYPPFNGGTEYLTYDLVKAGEVVFPSPSWDHVSDQAIAFVKRLLILDPMKRPSASEALEDPWLNQKQVQPLGLAWAASFFTRHSSFDHHQVKHVDEDKRSGFANYRTNSKVSQETTFLDLSARSIFELDRCSFVFVLFVLTLRRVLLYLILRQKKKAQRITI